MNKLPPAPTNVPMIIPDTGNPTPAWSNWFNSLFTLLKNSSDTASATSTVISNPSPSISNLASSNYTYITQTPASNLPNAQALNQLPAGLLQINKKGQISSVDPNTFASSTDNFNINALYGTQVLYLQKGTTFAITDAYQNPNQPVFVFDPPNSSTYGYCTYLVGNQYSAARPYPYVMLQAASTNTNPTDIILNASGVGGVGGLVRIPGNHSTACLPGLSLEYNGHYAGFTVGASITGSNLWALPNADAAGVWQSDGAGNLSISPISIPTASSSDTYAYSFAGGL